MKAVAIFLSVLNSVLALHTIPFEVRNIRNESLWTDVETRIYGGTEAKDGQFPFMVFVMIKYSPQLITSCSASYIKPDWVLLAAHCVEGQNLQPRNIIVAAGKAKLRDYIKKRIENYDGHIDVHVFGIEEKRAVQFFIHPDYNSKLEHDVALIRLPEPFTFSYAKTISVSQNVMKSPQYCTILGWGLTLGNLLTFNLNYADNKKVKTTKHGCSYKSGGPFICLEPDGRGICQGDSGSPLVCNNEVWGVASHYISNAPNPDCGNSLEEYYAEIYHDRDWINRKTGGNSAVINSKSLPLYAVPFLLSAMWSIKI